MNRIQSKNHILETCKFQTIYLSSFNFKGIFLIMESQKQMEVKHVYDDEIKIFLKICVGMTIDFILNFGLITSAILYFEFRSNQGSLFSYNIKNEYYIKTFPKICFDQYFSFWSNQGRLFFFSYIIKQE